MKNRFTMSRTGEAGVQWCRFRGRKENSGFLGHPRPRGRPRKEITCDERSAFASAPCWHCLSACWRLRGRVISGRAGAGWWQPSARRFLHYADRRAWLNFPEPTHRPPSRWVGQRQWCGNTALSPDGTALLILTTGYNTGFNTQGPDGTPYYRAFVRPAHGSPIDHRHRMQSGYSFSMFAARSQSRSKKSTFPIRTTD